MTVLISDMISSFCLPFKISHARIFNPTRILKVAGRISDTACANVRA